MRYLITGEQGFVGRHLTARLLRTSGAAVFGVGRSPPLPGCFTHYVTAGGRKTRASFPLDLAVDERRYQYQAIDILDQTALAAYIEACRPDVIFHLASGLWGDDPASLAATNIRGTVSLVAAMSNANCTHVRLVIGSSGAVYGIPTTLPIDETSVARPAEIYGVTKLVAENAALSAARSVGIEAVFGRIFNIVGAGADERHAPARFAQQIADFVQGTVREIQVGDLDTTRDFVDARDVAEALLILAERGVAGEAYNVGTGVETGLAAIVEQMLARARISPPILRTHFRKTDIPRHVASIGKLRALGYVPGVSLDDSLAAMVDYYSEPGRVLP